MSFDSYRVISSPYDTKFLINVMDRGLIGFEWCYLLQLRCMINSLRIKSLSRCYLLSLAYKKYIRGNLYLTQKILYSKSFAGSPNIDYKIIRAKCIQLYLLSVSYAVPCWEVSYSKLSKPLFIFFAIV